MGNKLKKMIHKTHEWRTKDRKKLFVQSWQPGEGGSKTILLVHGLGEHSGRYEEWAEKFVEKGFNFVSFDLRGHGKSSGKKGFARSVDVLLDDIDLALHHTRTLFPKTKMVLYGHSMGGNLILNHIIHRNRPLDAMVVSSPWLKLKKEPSKFLLALTPFLSKVFPRTCISNGLDPADISSDPAEAEKYRKDPLNHNKISFRLFREIYDSGQHALRNIFKINAPILVLHGIEDVITSPSASREFVRNTNANTKLKLWDGQYHELHHDTRREEVFGSIISWLSESGID